MRLWNFGSKPRREDAAKAVIGFALDPARARLQSPVTRAADFSMPAVKWG
ncbi:hypothetical protein [Brucella pseudogrignonensis]|nr:hypothetical protein [Brucella pseudogrignonensis]